MPLILDEPKISHTLSSSYISSGSTSAVVKKNSTVHRSSRVCDCCPFCADVTSLESYRRPKRTNAISVALKSLVTPLPSASSSSATTTASKVVSSDDSHMPGTPNTIIASHASVTSVDWSDGSESLLQSMADEAVRQVQSIASSQAIAGKWKLHRQKKDTDVDVLLDLKERDQYQVIARVNVPCTLNELLRVLMTTSVDELNASMMALFGERYISASTLESIDCTPNHHYSRSSMRHRRMTNTDQYMSVKVASLTSRRFLSCSKSIETVAFLDYLERDLYDKSATRVMQTIDNSNGVLNSLQSTTSEPHNILAGYVMQEDSSSQSTHVLFYGSQTSKHHDLKSSTSSRLKQMARLASRLEKMVLRRRLGFQPITYPDHVPSLGMPVRCSSCFSAFSVLRKPHFCHLCAFYVCGKCSTTEEVEQEVGWIKKLRFCGSCVAMVSDCMFESEGFEAPDLPMVVPTDLPEDADEDEDPEELIRAALEARNGMACHTLAKTWADLLLNSIGTDELELAIRVARHCISTMGGGAESDIMKLLDEDLLNSLDAVETQELEDHLEEELSQVLSIRELPVDACHMNQEHKHRTYQLIFNKETKIARGPTVPNESRRIRKVQSLGLYTLHFDPTLDLLCQVAAMEMSVMTSYVTTLSEHEAHFIAGYGTPTHVGSRDDNFCSYALQSRHPFMVRNALQDVRMRHHSDVLHPHIMARFYVGIPILDERNEYIIANFCIADTRPRSHLTTSEYSVLLQLAKTARRIILQRCRDNLR